MMKVFKKCGVPCKAAVVLAVVVAFTVLSGCSGTMKSNINTTQTVVSQDASGKPVTVVTNTESDISKPKDIVFAENTAEKHRACVKTVEVSTSQAVNLGMINVGELKSGAAQSDYFDAITVSNLTQANMVMAQALGGDPEAACHEAVAKEAVAYFAMEAKRSTNRWSFGKFLAGFAGAWLIADSITDGMATANAPGDTNIGEVNVSGNATGGPGGEAAGGLATVEQNINLGNGSLSNAQDGGLNAFGEKPIMGDNNILEDNDSATTSLW